jgi:hypothetical protein
MGADLCLTYVTIRRDKKPNWDAGQAAINRLDKKWKAAVKRDPDFVPDEDTFGGRDAEDIISDLKADLSDLKEGVKGLRRDMTTIIVGIWDIYVTGGMSWGDDPTDLYAGLRRLYDAGIIKACGFKN